RTLVVFPPGTTRSERARLRAWSTWPGVGALLAVAVMAALAGSFGATAPAGATGGQSDPLDLSVLNSIGINVPGGIQLLGQNGLVNVGVAGQVAATDTTSAVAAAGAVGADGAIQVGPGTPGTGATVNLTPLLGDL
ncbi:choice-of-anchor G family protein, partial [Bacillus sp. S34]|nr:choice-of-anchor G family protein [Bacillus sp. S34]